MARRPRIVVPARFSASASALRYQAEVVPRRLMEAVFAAGGEPLAMHPHPAPDDEVASRLAVADGVLLPGGGDLAAASPHPSLYDVDRDQDAFDLAVARVCLRRAIPLLAICRGLQVVNAARGGTLVPDMPDHHRHRRHRIEVRKASHLPGPHLDVSCYHHQCVATLGEGLVAVAHAADGAVEAVEIPDTPGWFLGVQWHPEDTWEQDLAVFTALVEAAWALTPTRRRE